MKIQEIINDMAHTEEWTRVKAKDGHLPKQATENLGTVTAIKPHGIAVRWEGMKWDCWYCELNLGDKRSKYMDHLIFHIEKGEI